jgi:hypothetical protein
MIIVLVILQDPAFKITAANAAITDKRYALLNTYVPSGTAEGVDTRSIPLRGHILRCVANDASLLLLLDTLGLTH